MTDPDGIASRPYSRKRPGHKVPRSKLAKFPKNSGAFPYTTASHMHQNSDFEHVAQMTAQNLHVSPMMVEWVVAVFFDQLVDWMVLGRTVDIPYFGVFCARSVRSSEPPYPRLPSPLFHPHIEFKNRIRSSSPVHQDKMHHAAMRRVAARTRQAYLRKLFLDAEFS